MMTGDGDGAEDYEYSRPRPEISDCFCRTRKLYNSVLHLEEKQEVGYSQTTPADPISCLSFIFSLALFQASFK